MDRGPVERRSRVCEGPGASWGMREDAVAEVTATVGLVISNTVARRRR
jgi:hypothetical protein